MRCAILLVFGGCFHPQPASGLACAPDGWCPPPQTCGTDDLCHSGNEPPVDAMPDAALPSNYAFVTSAQRTIASFADVSELDAWCGSLAAAQGKAGTYVAWFSTPSANAIDRIAGHAGWIRPDGETFATSTANITAGKLLYPLRLDEKATDQGEVLVATATGSDGTYTFGATCFNNGTGSADYGFAHAGIHWWTSSNNPSTVGCTRPVQFYCFEVDARPQAPAPAHTGRRAFLSATGTNGGQTRNGMDATCQAEATGGATYVALVASSGSDALSRVPVGAPLVRPDGVVFMTGDTHTITAPLNVTMAGTYEDIAVWAGSPASSQQPADATDDCNNWADPTSTGTGREGSCSQTSDSYFGNGGKTQCSLSLRVYCIEP